ncbi:MAG: hypothetical protein IBJ09_07615 [Bacteroidia bacterium]|nr:hypothetical protein [Bacteroidia bacterium]
MKEIRKVQKIIQSSLFLMIILPAVIFSLGNILTWILGFADEPSEIELILNPFAGGFIGVIGYVYLKGQRKIEEQEQRKPGKALKTDKKGR